MQKSINDELFLGVLWLKKKEIVSELSEQAELLVGIDISLADFCHLTVLSGKLFWLESMVQDSRTSSIHTASCLLGAFCPAAKNDLGV